MTIVRVDRDRLWQSLMRLKEIGGYDDAATGLRGVRRLALTDEDAEARRLVMSWMVEAGLTVRVDRIGNVYGEPREYPRPEAGANGIDVLANAVLRLAS